MTATENYIKQLKKGSTVLYETKGGVDGVKYIFNGLSKDGTKLKYKINSATKYLPLKTIDDSIQIGASGNLTREWFKNNFLKENDSAPCNFCVLTNILKQLQRS